MEASKILSKVSEMSRKLTDLLTTSDENKVAIIIGDINKEICELEKESELEHFITSLKQIISIFDNDPDENVRKESLLRLLSIVSTERTRVIQKYTLCSEPE